jgi:hypothetical protein
MAGLPGSTNFSETNMMQCNCNYVGNHNPSFPSVSGDTGIVQVSVLSQIGALACQLNVNYVSSAALLSGYYRLFSMKFFYRA